MSSNDKIKLIKTILFIQSIMSFISSLMFTISGDQRFFSRLALAVLCVGFYGIIEVIENRK